MALYSKMILIYSILIVSAMTCFALDAVHDPHPYCFQFTWIGRATPEGTNCTELTDTPCVRPFIKTDDDSPPNVTYMWEHLNRTEISCPLSNGFACLKYSYTYNDAALNITYFCGKMIEDKTLAIEEGCYTQKVSGHTIEACACKSGGGMMPCNSSIRSHSAKNILIIVTSILMLVYSNRFGAGFFFDL